MKYQIVDFKGKQIYQDDFEGSIESFIKVAEKLGYPCVGFKEQTGYLREYLIGQPVLQGLLGPMGNGPDCIRYESQKAYNLFSD